MKPSTKLAIAFPIVCAALLWIGGYDFDTRSPYIFLFTAWVVAMTALIATFP